MSKKLVINDFIEKAKKIHGNKYDYSLVKYINSKTKVKIICLKHGVFEQEVTSHLSGHGCSLCSGSKKSNTLTFIKKAISIHGNEYDYSNVKYINAKTKIDIICSIHGIFKKTPNKHLNGQGCPKCSYMKIRLMRITQIEKDKFNGNQIIPSYNSIGCEIFDKISEEKNIHIQHAQNGGEYYIKELGYWVDGYDSINNTVYEYDEKYHERKKQKEKDLIRELEIIKLLKCKFIRIKEK